MNRPASANAFIAAFAAAFVMVASAASPGKISNVEKFEQAVQSAFARGDYLVLYDAIKSLLLAHPDSPESAPYYGTFFQMADFFGREKIAGDARTIIEAVKKNNATDVNRYVLLLTFELEKLLYEYDAISGKKITDTLSPLRTWTLFGPYAKYGSGDLNYQFQPELVAFDKDAQSRKKIHVNDWFGSLDLGKFLFPDSGIAYAQSSFKVSGPVKIHIHSKGSYKAFINGKEAIKNVPGNSRNVRIVKVWNTSTIRLLLKVAGSPFKGLRVIVTDERDTVLSPALIDVLPGYEQDCDFSEESEFYNQMFPQKEAQDSLKINVSLARYFANLGSEECIGYFKKALSSQRNEFLSFLLASFLINADASGPQPEDDSEGWKIMDGILSANPDYIPAACKKLGRLVEKKDYGNAIRKAKLLIVKAPRNPIAWALYVRLLNEMEYEKDFKDSIDILKKRFPESVCALEEEAAYHKNRDKNKHIETSINLLKKKFSVAAGKTLFKELISRGDYERAAAMIKAYNHNNDFANILIDAHIASGAYKTGRNLIIRQLLTKSDPSLYYALGALDVLEQDDPSLYFQKLLSINPSNFVISDYFQYINFGTVKNPFSQFNGQTGAMDPPLIKKGDPGQPSSVLHRGRTFLLQSDGSSRTFYEDILYVNDERGRKRWSKITVPYPGKFQPVHLRVYDEKGDVRSAYAITEDGSGVNIAFDGLQNNSIIQLSYIIDNPITGPRDSAFFSIPVEYLQDYDEPVARVSVKVIAPEKMKVHFFLGMQESVMMSRSDDLSVYTILMENLPAVKKPAFLGEKQRGLRYFSFSTIDTPDDFVIWYSGLVQGKTALRGVHPDFLKKATPEKTAAAVYDFVAGEISLKGNRMFCPQTAEHALNRKQGSVEDKVLLAQALFERFGIRTFIAFARNKHLPDPGKYVAPEMFTHILLFVPLDVNDALWLDFSEPVLGCGMTRESINGTPALVIVNGTSRIVKVKNRETALKAGEEKSR